MKKNKQYQNITIMKGIMIPKPGRKATKEDLERMKEIEEEIKKGEEMLKKWKK